MVRGNGKHMLFNALKLSILRKHCAVKYLFCGGNVMDLHDGVEKSDLAFRSVLKSFFIILISIINILNSYRIP